MLDLTPEAAPIAEVMESRTACQFSTSSPRLIGTIREASARDIEGADTLLSRAENLKVCSFIPRSAYPPDTFAFAPR